MIQYRDPKESEAQVRAFARRVLRRVHSLGARSATLDDIEQELWIAWCKACEVYDPKFGAAFSTFLFRGMRQHINRYVESTYERFHQQTVAMAIDAPLSEDGASLSEMIEDSSIDFEADFEQEQNYEFAVQHLSERARIFVSLLKDQPEELTQEFRKLQLRSDYAKQLGIPHATPQRLAAYLIFDFMGASRGEREEITAEVEQLGACMIARSNV